MKKIMMFLLKYVSVTAAFFIGGSLVLLVSVLFGADFSETAGVTILKLLIISAFYAVSSPITFSVKHFIKYSMTSRLLIQTAVNYPILIICAFIFGWMTDMDVFCKVTTAYFFAGMAATLFICLYYPRKYKLYNEGLKLYKKKVLLDQYKADQ